MRPADSPPLASLGSLALLARLAADALPVRRPLRVVPNPRLNDLEHALLTQLLAGDDRLLELLRAQLQVAVPTTRRLSGVGFFLDFAVPEDTALVDPPAFTISDIHFDLENLEGPAGSILFVRDGALSMLEGFSYLGSTWPDEPRLGRIYYVTGESRDLAKLKEGWQRAAYPRAT